MQSAEDAAFKSLCALLRNHVQKVHGHAGQGNPSGQELADAVAPLLYRDAGHLPTPHPFLDLHRIILHMPLKVLGRILRIARNISILTYHNATDMCGRIASNVSTIGTARPTRKGLLKAFADPKGELAYETTESDQKVRELCVRVIEYIDSQGKPDQKI